MVRFGGDCRLLGCNFLRKDSEPGIHRLASGIHKSHEIVGQMLYVFTFSKKKVYSVQQNYRVVYHPRKFKTTTTEDCQLLNPVYS